MKYKHYLVVIILITTILSLNLFLGCSSSSDDESGTVTPKYQFATFHEKEGYIMQALREKGVNFNKINQDTEALLETLVVDGGLMTASELGSNETVKAYLKKNKGVLVLNATGEHKNALKKYVGMVYGTHDTRGYFVTCIPGSKGRRFAILEHPRVQKIKAEDFQNTDNDDIDTSALESEQEAFAKEVESKLGPKEFAANIIEQLEENKKFAAGKISREEIPDGLKYREWKLPYNTVYWKLSTAWLYGYPNVKWRYPADDYMTGYQQGSYGHHTFVAVYLDNKPSNGGDNFQWLSVDFQGWSDIRNPGPNSTYISGKSVAMPLEGDKYNVLDTKNFEYKGWGWGQMQFLMRFINPDNPGLEHYKALPETENSEEEYHSGSSFDVGFSRHGVDAVFGVDNSVVTEQPDWKVDVNNNMATPSYSWMWRSDNPQDDGGKTEHMNDINLGTFQPNSSAVMTTSKVINDTYYFTVQYGVNMLTTAAYYKAWPAEDHDRKDIILNNTPFQVAIDFGAVLYPLPSQLNISPSSIEGGSSTTGTITIDQAAPEGGVTVNLSSSNTTWATVPETVTIPEGQSSQTFTITTYTVTGNSVATITANLNQVEVTANVTVEASLAK